MLTFGAQDPHRASELAELALVDAAGDDAARALALETAAILDMNLDRADRARDRAEAALAFYRRLGDAAGVARILDGRAMATFLDGRITDAVQVLRSAAELFTDSGELLRAVTPRSTRGHGLVFMDRPADGLAEADAALRLARDLDAPEARPTRCGTAPRRCPRSAGPTRPRPTRSRRWRSPVGSATADGRPPPTAPTASRSSPAATSTARPLRSPRRPRPQVTH